MYDIVSVSEIKGFFCALAGCTSHKTVHPENSPCTLLIYRNNKWLKKLHTPGAHLLKSCTRPWKYARRVQGAPLISDTEYLVCDHIIIVEIAYRNCCTWIRGEYLNTCSEISKQLLHKLDPRGCYILKCRKRYVDYHDNIWAYTP